MRISDAIEQLETIHEHLTKAEVYRGFAVPGVALVGVLGLLGAAAMDQVTGVSDPARFVRYWLLIAAVGAALGLGTTAHSYLVREDEVARRKTRRVLAQFLPCLAAGGLVTAALLDAPPDMISFLPGLWAIIFGLGMISARPYLAKGVGFVGLGYVVAGGVLLARATNTSELFGWQVGGVFGAGHLLTALVLWCDRPRDSNA